MLFGAAAVAAPLLTPYDPAAANAALRLAGPSPEHPLGTDNLGRDTLTRLLVCVWWSATPVWFGAWS